MKLRSSILFGCLIVVPLIAMFSHKVPRSVREGLRDRVWQPAVDRVAHWFTGEPDPPGGAIQRSAFAPVSPSVQEPAVVAAARVASAGEPDAAPPTTAPMVVPGVVAGPPVEAAVAAPPQKLPVVSVKSTLLPESPRVSIDERLAALGAVGLKVKPPEGPSGLHVASCRVPADASGQLQRLFQASGATAEMSLERLAVQIEAWRSRVASTGRGPSGRDGASDGQPSAGPWR